MNYFESITEKNDFDAFQTYRSKSVIREILGQKNIGLVLQKDLARGGRRQC